MRPHRYDACLSTLTSLPPQYRVRCHCGAEVCLPATARQGDPWGEDCPIADEEEAPVPVSPELAGKVAELLAAARQLATATLAAAPLAGDTSAGHALDRAYAEVSRAVAALERAAKEAACGG